MSYSDKKTQQIELENLIVLVLGCFNWVGLGRAGLCYGVIRCGTGLSWAVLCCIMV